MYNHCGEIKEVLAHNKMEMDSKERGLESSGPRSTDKVACQQGDLGGMWLWNHHMMDM